MSDDVDRWLAEDVGAGDVTAEATVAEPTQIPPARRTLRIVREPAVGDHTAPMRTDPLARRTFWRPLDELLAQAASGSRPCACLTRSRLSLRRSPVRSPRIRRLPARCSTMMQAW